MSMKQMTLGASGMKVSRIGLGCVGMSALYSPQSMDDNMSIRTIHRAVDLGVTLLDTAENYGPYVNEELLGRALKGRREKVTIATKVGTILHRSDGSRGFDGTAENVRLSVEGCLRRLDTDWIDLLYQHRMDPHTPIEETASAMSELIAEGKIRHYGLSEASPSVIRRAHAVHPLAAVQSEYSLWTRGTEADILPTVRELGIGFVAYSPLGRGFLTGTIRSVDSLDVDDFRRTHPRFAVGNFESNLRIVSKIEGIASECAASAAQVSLAWLLAQGDDIVPIPGTKRVDRLEENIAATAISLTEEQLASLNSIDPPQGARYSDMSHVHP